MTILICGAGIAGLALAWCLERRGHQPLVVERTPRLRDEGYMIDFFGSGCDAAERLGLLSDLASIHYAIDRLMFVDGHGRERFSVAYLPLRRRLFNNRHFNFLRGDLERVLYQRFEGHDRIRFGTTVTSFEQDHGSVRVLLSDGTVEVVDALVGADGVHSHIRRMAFGEESQFARFLDYRMASYIIEELPHSLSSRDVFWTLTLPRRQVTVYPIRGDRSATFFLHKVRSTGERYSPESPCHELQQVYGDLNWVVPDLLDRCRTARTVYFDDVGQIEMPRWSKGRVVLIGDACWCVSPLAGQGASMALAGAYVLAEELDNSKNVDVALAQYEHRVKPAIERQQKAGRRIAKWFVPDDQRHLVVRDMVTRVSAWPLVAAILRHRMAAQSIFPRG